MFPKTTFSVIIAALLFGLFSCKKEVENETTNDSELKIGFEHYFDNEKLILNKTYIAANQNELKFNKIKYYISNVILKREDGTEWVDENCYYLMDEWASSVNEIHLKNIPAGNYTQLSYLVGVDSAMNVEGDQAGVLAPANNMLWSWASGYIFIKLEGRSPQADRGFFAYHVGGFSGNLSVLERVNHTFKNGGKFLDNNATENATIRLQVDQIFATDSTKIDVGNMDNTVHSMGEDAQKVAAAFRNSLVLQ